MATATAGAIALDMDAAKSALERDVGNGIGLSTEMAAYAVYEMVSENMASAARVHAVERGKELQDRTMIAFGGADAGSAAAVLLYRGFTFALEIPVGGAWLAGWLWTRSRARVPA